MDWRSHNRSMTICALLSAVCAVALLTGCGGPKGTLDQLSVTQYRYNLDEAGSVARVVGVARNTGEERTPAADIVVTLVGRTGAHKGQNRAELPSLDGGAEHRFALGVTAHGRVEDVHISIVPRGALLEGETAGGADGETAGGADGETEGGAEAGADAASGGGAPANADATTDAGDQSDAGAQEGE